MAFGKQGKLGEIFRRGKGEKMVKKESLGKTAKRLGSVAWRAASCVD
jgi:hypothetical protein